MRWLKITGITLGVLALLLIVVFGAGYIGLALYDWNNLKPRFAKALEDATGREVTIEGDVTMDLSLSPTIGLNDIVVQNADWGTEPKMMTIPHMEIEFQLLSLLDNRTEVNRIFVSEPDLLLETNESGERNLQPGQDRKKKQQKQSGGTFIHKIHVENGSFTFHDMAREKSYEGHLKKFLATAEQFDGPLQVNARGTYAGRNLSLEGTIDSQAALMKKNRDLQVDLNASLGDATVKADGTIPASGQMEKANLNFSAEGNNFARVMALVGMSVPIEKSFDLSGKVGQEDGSSRWQISGKGRIGEMDVSVDGSVPDFEDLGGLKTDISVQGPDYEAFMALFKLDVPVPESFDLAGSFHLPAPDQPWQGNIEGNVGKVALKLDGSLPKLTTMEGLVTDISAEGPDFSTLMGIFTLDVPIRKAFDITTTFGYPAVLTYHLDNTRAQVGESDYKGRIVIDASADPVALTVNGTSGTLKPAEYIEPYTDDSAPDGNRAGAPGQVFPDRPLPLDTLDIMTADVDLKANNLILPYLSFNDFSTNFTLQGGHLNVRYLQSEVGSGTVSGHFDIQSNASPPQITARLQAQSIKFDELLRDRELVETIAGNMDVSVDIRGSGNTYADVMAGLDGQVSLTMSGGRFYNEYIRLLGANVVSGLVKMINPFDRDIDYVRINCLVSRFTIDNGMAKSTALVLDTPEVAIVGDGRINLKTEEISIPLNTIPKKGIGIKDVVNINMSLSKMVDPFKISGTLSSPDIKVDASSALFSIGKAIGGVALFGPAGLAASLISGGVGKESPCAAVLRQRPEQQDDARSGNADQQTTLQEKPVGNLGKLHIRRQ